MRRRDGLLALAASCVAGRALGAGAEASGPVEVRFEIDMTSEVAAGRFDPAHDRVGVRGSLAPLSWASSTMARPAGPAGTPGNHRYAVTVRFGRRPYGGQPVQYKFRIEKGAGQGADDGWEPGRNHALVLDAAVLTVARAFGDMPAPTPLSRIGRFESFGVVTSRHVTPRPVQAWLPPGYGDDPARRHPVLVLHDGQAVFDAAAAGAEWQVDEAADALVRAGAIEPPVIVGVHATAERVLDYTPTAARPHGRFWAPRAGGGLPAYARFLIDELKPMLASRLAVRAGGEHWAVGGSSLGGLASLWLALHHPREFGAALVVSPSVWWDGGFALRDVRAPRPDGPRPRLWLDMGAHEGPGAVEQARALRDALRESGWADGADLAWTEDPDGAHDEASWAARVPAMLRFLYGRPAPAGRPALPPTRP